MSTPSMVHGRIPARGWKPIQASAVKPEQYNELRRIGFPMDEATVRSLAAGYASDALTDPVLPANITTPVQFLQTWLPGFVYAMTQPRSIDNIIGMTAAGSVEDEEIVQQTLEHAGTAGLYGDHTNFPLAGVGNGYERRTIVRFEMGMGVDWLEAKRAGKASIDLASERRAAAAMALEIRRNQIGFNGFNNGANRTYGFLNDPALPAYLSVAAGVGGNTWALKTFLEITQDIATGMNSLTTRSKGLINIQTDPVTLAVSLSVIGQLAKTNEFGTVSVWDWIAKTYPRLRVVGAPELDGANGGANVLYFYAERVADSGTDGGTVFEQFVPAKTMTIGTETRAKGMREVSINATAGVMLKRPYAVSRYTGV